ncbi:MAG: tetratricopeptide repeat protein [Planctomycetota bacterium]
MTSDYDDIEPASPVAVRGGGDQPLQRAMMLMQQRRLDDAIEQLKLELSKNPDSSVAHGLMALCLLDKGDTDAALREANLAIQADPDEAFSYHILSRVRTRRDEDIEAETAAREALRLDPYQSGYYADLANSLIGQERWAEALEAADEGLSVDPDDWGCRNLRATVLTQLGRRDEADATLRGALERDPDDSHTHANLGWTQLHKKQHKLALESFREALRLDPTNQWAKAGMVEALKAKNPFYRVFLSYMLWMSRLSDKAQWAVIIGAWAGYQVFKAVGQSAPELKPIATGGLIVYVGFVAVTWLAVPLFNLSLRFNKYGWHALTQDQRRGANLLGGLLLAAGLTALPWTWSLDTTWLFAAAIIAGLLVPAVGIHRVATGKPRLGMTVFFAAMASLATVLLVGLAIDPEGKLFDTALFGIGVWYVIGVIASFWAVNIVASKYPNNTIA